MTYQECVKLSWLVRRKCAQFARSSASRTYDFHNHKRLGAMCAIASMTLRCASGNKFIVQIGKYALNEQCTSWGNHCWVEYKDWIIDITATQFGVNIPVFIGRKENCGWKYKKGKLGNHYSDYTWGNRQNPTSRLIKQILAL